MKEFIIGERVTVRAPPPTPPRTGTVDRMDGPGHAIVRWDDQGGVTRSPIDTIEPKPA